MRLALFALALLICLPVYAGFAAGPFLAFYNLSPTQVEVTETVRKYIHGRPATEFCGDTALGWIVYTHDHPIPAEEVRVALTRRNASNFKSIAHELRAFRAPDIENGLDGAVAFVDENGGYFASIDARGNYVRSVSLRRNADSARTIEAFCSVIPTVYRK
jgi:hypothetical protein